MTIENLGLNERINGDKREKKISTSQSDVNNAIILSIDRIWKKIGWKQRRIFRSTTDELKKTRENVFSTLFTGYTSPLPLGVSGLKKMSTEIWSQTILTESTNSNCRSTFNEHMYHQEFNHKPMTEEIMADLSIIKNRNYLDPKRFYKSSDIPSKKSDVRVQIGTVIEGPDEFYSSRLTKKERRKNLTEQAMSELYDEKGMYIRKTFERISKDNVEKGLKRAYGKKKRKGGFGRLFQSSQKKLN